MRLDLAANYAVGHITAAFTKGAVIAFITAGPARDATATFLDLAYAIGGAAPLTVFIALTAAGRTLTSLRWWRAIFTRPHIHIAI